MVMTKNKLEKLFSYSCRHIKGLFYMKLHNNPASHQTTPADYILSYPMSDLVGIRLTLVECKQVTCKDGKGRIAFKRLKQMHDLLNFLTLRPVFHKSYFCIAFYDNGWIKSEIYIIPVMKMYESIQETDQQSYNRTEMKELFGDYLVPIRDKLLQIQNIV